MPKDFVSSNLNHTLSDTNKYVRRFFKLSLKDRERIYKIVKENAIDDFSFYLLTVLGTIIITLGLIINSGAVVIGGMLITPIIWPILAFSLSVIKGRVFSVQKYFFVVLKTTIIVFIVSLLVGFISPFDTFKEEVLSRTEPTLIELLIGFAAGFIGAYAVSSKKILSSIGGVAVAVSLVPPLCVAGLTLSSGDYSSAVGAFLLYVSNLLGISTASLVVFILEGYFTTASVNIKNARKNYLTWSFILLILTTIPLLILTKSLISEQKTKTFILQTTKNVYPNIVITNISVNDDITIVVDLTAQSAGDINTTNLENLARIYSKKFKKPVTINLDIIELKKYKTTTYTP